MERVVVRSRSPLDTRRLGEALGRAAKPGDALLLEGSFGAGKTVLVQGLGAGLGVRDHITSPSFVLMVEHQGRLRLYHVDLYRLGDRLDPETLEAVGDALDAGGVCAVEWPSVLPADYRTGASTLRFIPVDAQTRDIILETPSLRLATAVRGLGATEN
ncbi:MAG: tRNA (adenosine(37)-N6)-threonylcarbamoyltransferase complex ATPase subunit type 1 TsaE [Chloroflexi bacterium]|nr:tRNA (adenosine(37)-N6)-threonylcarbamoyltransferase complex ATPase subunit type 1 TsaE [Chloroflexota bacterium]